ncbi:hypothetical protein VT03_31215 [Planctomyces sp. SH-PL14]|jgi:hypothetical protein|nr:hypothetical protein VT03_31215 [Planctomyces sp. SH-PL14]
MILSQIDFSADFGGRDAATAVLPHFKALKTACNGLRFQGFPFPKLAYILRVDGEVNQYGLSGVGYLDIDRKGEYLSLDIGIERDDRERIPHVICDGLLGSMEYLQAVNKKISKRIEFQPMQECLLELVGRYRRELSH